MSCEVLSIDGTTYKLLTIGDITKICSDKILFDNDGNVSLLQWFTFQLDFLLKKIGISNNDSVTGYKLTRMQIYNILDDMYKCNIDLKDIIKNDIEEWENLGFISKNIKNSYTNYNVGGNPILDFTMNNTKSDIIYPKENKIFSLDEKSGDSHKASEKHIKIPTKIITKKKNVPELTVSVNNRIIKGRKNIEENITNSCLNLGKLDWIRNSCYADSILLLIFYRIINKKDSYLYNLITKFKYTTDLLNYNSALLCPDSTSLESVMKYNNILDNFREILYNIENKNIIHVSRLVNSMSKCPIRGAENFNDGLYHDTSEFLSIILRYFLASVENTNIEKEYLFSVDNNNLDTIINERSFYFDYIIPDKDGLGKDFSTVVYTPDVKSGEIQNYSIKSDTLASLYNQINVPDREIEYGLATDKGKYKYDPLLNKIILKSEELRYNLQKVTIKKEIKDMICSKVVSILSDESYHIIDERYTYQETGEGYYFYLKENRDDPSQWVSYEKLQPGIAFKIKSKVNEYRLNNTSNDIFINLERSIKRIYNGQLIEKLIDVKIIPNEFITIDGVKFVLYGLTVWTNGHYISFLRCNDEYYVYDDNYDPLEINDYIVKIGPHTELCKYRYKSKSNIVLTNSRILYYVKE